MLNPDIEAVLFDLDGVLTPTATIHEEAWRRLFSRFFEDHEVAPYTDEDYFEHLDGRARYDAVAAILEARGIHLPYGDPSDPPEAFTICGLGNRKNLEFNHAIASEGVQPYPGSLLFLDYIAGNMRDKASMKRPPLKVAVVSSSKNAPEVLRAAGLFDHFPVIIDGNVAAQGGLPGKPDAATYLEAASQLGLAPEVCAVVEDAVSGVQAGRNGNFGMVIGVDRGAGADVLAENGATLVVDDLAQLVPHESVAEMRPGFDIPYRYPVNNDPDWQISEAQFTVEGPDVKASLLAQTNGYLGMRGDVGLRFNENTRGTFLNGLHEVWPITHAEDAYGFARIGQSMVTLPDATGFDVFVNGVSITDEDEGEILFRSRTFDLQAGVLIERITWRGAEMGPAHRKSVRVEQRSAVALFDSHLATLQISVTPLTGDCELEIRSIVDTPALPPVLITEGIILELDDPRKANKLIAGAVVETEVFPGTHGATVSYRVRASKMAAALSVSNRSEVVTAIHDGGSVEAEYVATTPVEPNLGESLAWSSSALVERGNSLVMTKRLAYARDDLFEPWPGNPTPRAEAALATVSAIDPEQFFTKQAARLAELWERADITIEQSAAPMSRIATIIDDPSEGSISLQAGVRWCLFQILQASSCISDTGVPAKGLTGSGYDGHYFWDSEIYLVPALIYTNPEAARQLLHYRYRTLDAARIRAIEMHESGALYPWRTIAGLESSAYYPAGTAQYHINAAIAYALDQYLNATGDMQFMLAEGVDVLVETARMWMSLGFTSGRDGKFHINGVTGPDEYTAVVNDNTYTNLMAQANLRYAYHWLTVAKDDFPEDYAEIIRRLALSDEEVASFASIADTMFIPWNEALEIFPQDVDFLDKQVWDFAGTPPENYPLLLNYHPLVIYRHQVLKQSDTVLALYLLGSQFEDHVKRSNFDYYDAITTGDSSLSSAAQSIVAAEVGHPELAATYFERLLKIDLADLHRNTDAGLHIASLGGTWSALIMGFAGLRDDTGTLRFAPRLPVNWSGMRFTLQIHGYSLHVHVTRNGIQFDYDAPDYVAVEVEVEGETMSIHGRGL
ncbi:HAD-IA family hydrolase [Actinomyces minihominis]|uniref:HAD-IA family hydrolase n=1 Tax=Actinomyces minihominis TaxID=2002838 RepID=UPI000C07783D|nr:HAD-IA family hydrolase [Actinomyces minihominis]